MSPHLDPVVRALVLVRLIEIIEYSLRDCLEAVTDIAIRHLNLRLVIHSELRTAHDKANGAHDLGGRLVSVRARARVDRPDAVAQARVQAGSTCEERIDVAGQT